MSVLSCDRNGCDNIMCDRLSDKYGYICNGCFDELVRTGGRISIADFMNTPKEDNQYSESFSDYCENEFPLRHETEEDI